MGKEDQAQAQAFMDTWTWDDHANQGLAEIQDNYLGHFTGQSIDLISGLTKVLKKGSLLAYLVGMTLRIVEIHRVLKPTGSFYLHCDPTSSHYLKIILDGIFCSQGGDFKNEIIWKRSDSHNDGKQGSKQYGRIHDVIFFYCKSNHWIWNSQYTELPQTTQEKWYKNIEPETGRRYNKADLTAAKPGGDTSYEWNGVKPPLGRFWAYSKAKMQKFEEQGLLVYSSSGRPYMKRYLDESKGVSLQDLWTDIDMLRGIHKKERLGYPTQKPEALLERIIKASSNEGDIILDAYCGCGTTIAVAEKLNRSWIGVDITYQSISLILRRLDSFGKKSIENIQLNGIPKDMESAVALANKPDDRTRKEFEKWAVLTYSNNRAVINEKKGADEGIDAVAYFQGENDDTEKIIFQVKSGKVKSGDIRDLQGTITLQQAVIGIFITLQPPTKDMIQTAKMAGIYQSRFYTKQIIDKIQIVTIQEILEEKKRIDIRLMFEVLKSAEKQRETQGTQISLEL